MASWIFGAISPLLKLWLSSQVEGVEDLHLEISSNNRELLQGKIKQGIVSAKNIIYQGLELESIYLVADSIELNVPQMLRGESLRLLQPINVKLKARIDRERLSPSLASPILENALGYKLKLPLTDQEIGSLILKLLELLQEEITIDRLEINEKGLECEAQFQIKAT